MPRKRANVSILMQAIYVFGENLFFYSHISIAQNSLSRKNPYQSVDWTAQ